MAEKSWIRVQLASIADDHRNDISIWQWYIVTIWFTMLKNPFKKSHYVYLFFGWGGGIYGSKMYEKRGEKVYQSKIKYLGHF